MDRHVSFLLEYDGPAVADHEMDVRYLGPALSALGELFDEANAVVNPGMGRITVNVKAPPKQGSIGIEMHLQSVVEGAVSLLSGDSATALANLLTYLGFAGGTVVGLVQFIRRLKGRAISRVTPADNDDYIIATVDGENISLPRQVVDLLRNLRVRKSLDKIVREPLRHEGFDKISFVCDGQTNVVEKSEGEYFAAPADQVEEIGEFETNANLQILNIAFQEGNKWRFSDGAAEFRATITDEDFLKRIADNREAFAKDDILNVTLWRRQYLTSGGMKADYEVRKVNSHRSAAVQVKLPFVNGGE